MPLTADFYSTAAIMGRLVRSLEAAKDASLDNAMVPLYMRGLRDGLEIAIHALNEEIKYLPPTEPKDA